MSIVRKNAEEKLVKYLNAIRQKHFGKILHVPSEVIYERHEIDLPVMVQLLRKVIDGADVTLFLCEDGDIIIVLDVARCPLSAMTTIIATYAGVDDISAINIFDMQINWFDVLTLAEKKFAMQRDRLIREKVKKEEGARKEYHDMIMNKKMATELVSSIAQRRMEREKPCILVVEDDLFSRTLVYKTLNRDYDVATAADGDQAIAEYALKAPDIVFLDIDLPDITGHEVLFKIKEMDSNAFIVMLSGNTDKKNVLSAIQEGAKGFVGKPFSRDKLLAYVDDALIERVV